MLAKKLPVFYFLFYSYIKQWETVYIIHIFVKLIALGLLEKYRIQNALKQCLKAICSDSLYLACADTGVNNWGKYLKLNF